MAELTDGTDPHSVMIDQRFGAKSFEHSGTFVEWCTLCKKGPYFQVTKGGNAKDHNGVHKASECALVSSINGFRRTSGKSDLLIEGNKWSFPRDEDDEEGPERMVTEKFLIAALEKQAKLVVSQVKKELTKAAQQVTSGAPKGDKRARDEQEGGSAEEEPLKKKKKKGKGAKEGAEKTGGNGGQQGEGAKLKKAKVKAAE